MQKGSRKRTKIGSLGGPRTDFGESRGDSGPKGAAETEQTECGFAAGRVRDPILGAKWEPKWSQMELKILSKMHQNLKSIVRCIFVEKGAKMEPT